MASAFGHALVGYTFSKVLDKNESKILMVLAIISSILPDIDVLSFKLGISYDHWLGHRGLTHSILFSIIWALLLSLIFGKQRKIIFFLVLFLGTMSHALLDAMTSGGEGVGFLIPYNESRYFFPFRPILVSPIGIERFFSKWGWKVICNEFIWIGIPCLVVLGMNIVKKKMLNINA